MTIKLKRAAPKTHPDKLNPSCTTFSKTKVTNTVCWDCGHQAAHTEPARMIFTPSAGKKKIAY